MKLDETTEIIEIKMLDIKTGRKWILCEISGRDMHFMKKFEFERYHIQLRLDWGDIRNGEPMLDADIWIEDKNGRKEFLRKKQPWHHTKKELDNETGLYIYKFKFNDLEMTLQPKKTMAKTFSIDVILVDSKDKENEFR